MGKAWPIHMTSLALWTGETRPLSSVDSVSGNQDTMLTAMIITSYVGFQGTMGRIKVFHCRSSQPPLKSPHQEEAWILLNLRNKKSLLHTCLIQYVNWTMHNEDCRGDTPTGQILTNSFLTVAWKISHFSGISNEFDSTLVQYAVNAFFSAQCERRICCHWP